MGWILGFGIPSTYLFGVMVTYRVLYTRAMTKYLRWKNEAPKQVVQKPVWNRYIDDMNPAKTRSEVSLKWYLRDNDEWRPMAPNAAWLWPALLTAYPALIGIARFCAPEVKVPDLNKIKKLELEDL